VSWRALVLDFDGLILDTETPLVAGWAEVFEAYGCAPITVAEWGAVIGTATLVDPVSVLVQRAGPGVDREVAWRQGRAAVTALIEAEATRPGVVDWLDEADRLGLATAVASSSPLTWVGGHLDRLGLAGRFKALACYRPGVRAKPAPDLYLEACAAVGAAPAQALAVEDSPNGVAAAKAAGLACLAVPNQFTAQLDLGQADLVLSSLAELSLGQALARLGGPP
jgi:HAD superfamily hydrolase (TIGR01509 family)